MPDPTRDAVAHARALARNLMDDFACVNSKEADERLDALITAAEARVREIVKRDAVDTLNAMREDGEWVSPAVMAMLARLAPSPRQNRELPMTTQHAPEGWDVARAAEEVRAAGHSLYSQGVGDGHPMCRAYGRDYEEGKQDLRVAIEALIAAARAEGATAERARLAGMASEEDRGMVDALDSICRSGRVTHLEWLEAYTTLLARLAAARGEALEEAVRWCWRNPVDLQDKRQEDYVARAIRALLAAPTKGEG